MADGDGGNAEPLEGTLILADEYEGEENLGGRPRHYETPEAFNAAVDAALQDHLAMQRPLTLTRLILHMGFASRQTMENYAGYEGFGDCVARAKTIVQVFYEDAVLMDKNGAAGRILGAMDTHFNPAIKVEKKDGILPHEDRLAHLR